MGDEGIKYAFYCFFFQAEDGIRDFHVTGVQTCALPICLGLQGIVEHFGGSLGVLDVPMHGKPSVVRALPGRLLRGLPERFTIGRYHSLYAVRSRLPAVLAVVAETEDDRVVMAIEHQSLPIAAVQFHPESVMTSPGEIGMPIIEAALSLLCQPAAVK